MSKRPIAFFLLVLASAGCQKSSTVTGASGAQLTLQAPAGVSLVRGGTATTELHIERHLLTGEVSINFADLPQGVEVVDSGTKIVGDRGTYTLRATDSAALVEKSVARVTASGAGGIAITQPISITVKPKS